MFAIIPRSDELLKEMLENDFDVTEMSAGGIKFFISCEIIDTLKKTKEHDELRVLRTYSVEVEGLCTEEEIEELKKIENTNALRILKIEHRSSVEERGLLGENALLQDYIDEDSYYVTAILHMDETQPFIEENVKQFVKS